jgi:hypothetical protein
MTHSSQSNVLFSVHLLSILLFLLLLNSSFIVLWSDSIQGVISIFLYLLRPKIWFVLEQVPGLLSIMYIALLQDGILCRHLSSPLDLWCHSILELLC